ncbi:MAG: trimethylamine methyltransferase family protein [Deltaproteobacteria bacterium]|nr:trimethylamine methyltransferase family protein [Deltaproteobacteria bacterium]
MARKNFTIEEITKIHKASMSVLKKSGVAFNDPQAITIFKKSGFRVDGQVVYFTEDEIFKALETVPSRFKLTARNPERSVFIGEDDQVFVGTYGAPFVYSSTGVQRPGTMEDYDNICKLVQTSRHVDMNGFKHVQPNDIRAESSYLNMLFSNIVLCNKPFMGSTDTRAAARDSLEMAGIVFGGMEKLSNTPVMIGLINSLSPLRYAQEMAGSIIEYARYRQPLCIANMLMAGTSGPVNLAGLLVLMNAELLAGIVLSQLVGPGTPVIYGTTSCPTNMKNGTASVGSPETVLIGCAAIQLAGYYKLPCRTGGSLTDAHVSDAQALAEGALILSQSFGEGAHFILHACGMIGGYLGVSLEKWLIDEELCGMIRRTLSPPKINEKSLSLESIEKMGIGGNYLMEPETLKSCRTAFFKFDLYSKQDHSSWTRKSGRRVEDYARDMLLKRLGAYEKPDIDAALESDLSKFVAKRKDENTRF